VRDHASNTGQSRNQGMSERGTRDELASS
jgi:hypothetical protein